MKHPFSHKARGTAVICTFLLLVTVCFSQYFFSLKRDLNSDALWQMSQRSQTSVRMIHSEVDSAFAGLNQLISSLSYNQVPVTDPALLNYLSQYSAKNNLGKLEIYDSQRVTMLLKDASVSAADKEMLSKLMEGDQVISDILPAEGEKPARIGLAVPIFRDGTVIGILRSSYSITSADLQEYPSISRLLDGGLLDSTGRIAVLQDDGTPIVYGAAEESYPNLIDAFANVTPISDFRVEQLQRELSEGKTTTIQFEQNGKDFYGRFVPVGIHRWYLLQILPVSELSNISPNISKISTVFAIEIIILVLLLIGYVFLVERRDTLRVKAHRDDLGSLINAVPGGVAKVLLDEEMHILYGSDGFYALTGYTRDEYHAGELNGCGIRLIYPEDRPAVAGSVQRQLQSHGIVSVSYRLIRKDGSIAWIMAQGALTGMQEEVPVLQCVFTDINDLKETQNRLQLEQDRYRTVMELSQEIVFEYDYKNDTLYTSNQWKVLFGYAVPEANGHKTIHGCNFVHPDDRETFRNAVQNPKDGRTILIPELRLRSEVSGWIWCKVSAVLLLGKDGQKERYIGMVENIHAQRQERERLLERSRCDALTKLFNRGETQTLITGLLENASQGSEGAFMMIDVDNFKGVNDTLGHLAGDEVLRKIAADLTRLFDQNAIVGRAGGDEFFVYLHEIPSEDYVRHQAELIVDCFRQLHVSVDPSYPISGSIGCALFPRDGASFNLLFDRADRALYEAKYNGKSRYEFFREALSPNPGYRSEKAGRQRA